MSLFCQKRLFFIPIREKHLYEIYVRVGLIKGRYYEKADNQWGRVSPLVQLSVCSIYATLVQPKCECSIASRYGDFYINRII